MAEESTISLVKEIPAMVVNEGGTVQNINLNEYIKQVSGSSEALEFSAEINGGQPLPKGLICTSDGFLSGIPAKGTQGSYEFTITAKNSRGETFETTFTFLIRPRPETEIKNDLDKLKTSVWEALEKSLPVPDLSDIMDRPITEVEIYYLLQRFATFSVWDVCNLDYPGEKYLLDLPGTSKHYNIYDRGCCIVGSPKDLFSHERTLEDALQTARVIAREVYKRGWAVEFAGFNKMARAAWVELQLLGERNNRYVEILHYSPGVEDILAYQSELKAKTAGPIA